MFGGIEFPSACSLTINDSSLLAADRMASSLFSILLIFCLNSDLMSEGEWIESFVQAGEEYFYCLA